MQFHRLLPLMLLAVAPARADVVPFLDMHCVSCHGGKKPKADLALDVKRGPADLVENRKLWQNVLDQVETGQMPPPKRPRPTPGELDAFNKSLRAVFDKADRATPPDPGRVTVRRLNRVEYNNTIRDLIGVDFNPAEDFPSDDVGHGFDNIGDVLSLSPVLMERYLAAAESMVRRAILVDVPKPAVRALASKWLQPALKNAPAAGRWRPIGKKDDAIFTEFNLTLPGEFTFLASVYAAPGSEPARIALMFQGKEIQTFDVKGTEKAPERFSVRVASPKGNPRAGVKLLSGSRQVFVEHFEMNGPLDPRPESHRRLLTRDASKPKKEQTREVLTRFMGRAYRRPATKIEVERLTALVEAAEVRGDKWEAAIRLAVQAVLVSPKFLFRLELDDKADSAEPRPVDEYALASRLSYFLWASMPDDELFALAGKNQLAANLDAQVRRMLKDPRAKSLVDNFAMQWLQLQRLKTVAPDATLFKHFSEELRDSMLKETELFLEAIIKEDRSILELIDADFTFINERLTWHYDIRDTNGNSADGRKPKGPPGEPIRGQQFKRVKLRDKERGGLLTMASVLTVTSNPTRTSPVKRGRWVLEQILGTPPPPPPPDVPELDNPKKQLTGTLRQRMEQHRSIASCAGCHSRMDPIGFAFENFDAVGAFRHTEGNQPINASGVMPDGRSFNGPAALKVMLKEKKDLFARCLTEKLLTYALGRGLEPYDRRAVERITAALARDNYKFSTLAVEIAKSDPFRLRRGSKNVVDAK